MVLPNPTENLIIVCFQSLEIEEHQIGYGENPAIIKRRPSGKIFQDFLAVESLEDDPELASGPQRGVYSICVPVEVICNNDAIFHPVVHDPANANLCYQQAMLGDMGSEPTGSQTGISLGAKIPADCRCLPGVPVQFLPRPADYQRTSSARWWVFTLYHFEVYHDLIQHSRE